MYSAIRSAGMTGFVILLSWAPLAAQCPDGTPPPCNRPAPVTARVALDSNLIAVFPFRVVGSSQDAGALREGAMDLLALALDEQAGLRVVPSRTLLARARNFTDASPVSDAATISRGLGAGTMILGSAIVVGTQVRARAELHDVARNRSIASVEAHGLASDPAPVIDSLAASLARYRLTNTGATRRLLQEVASTSPAAIRAYFVGESLGRRGRWREATDSLLAAIRIDSTFGLAYYRLSVAFRYGGSATSGPSIADPAAAALRFQDHLPRRQRLLLASVLATQHGVLREALGAADAVATAYPDDPEAAFEQGEAYWHVGMALGEPITPALQAYARALALDSTLIEPYNHAAELLYATGDSAGAMRLAARALALAPDGAVQRGTMLALQVIRGESPTVPVDIATRVELEMVRALSSDPARAIRLTERLLTTLVAPSSTRSDLETIAQARFQVLLNQGRLREALTLAVDRGDSLEVAIYAGSPPAVDSARIADDPVGTAWAAVRRGDTTTAGIAARALLRLPDPVADWGAALSAGVMGWRALSSGDTVRARALLPRLAEVKPFAAASPLQWDGMLTLARLEAAAGDTASALRRLAVANFFNGVMAMRAPIEEYRAQLALAHGDTATARQALRNFTGLWEHADPAFQPRVAAARAALARLTTR